MKTLTLLAGLMTAALLAGCQQNKRSATLSRDTSDLSGNEVTLRATSDDPNVTVRSDGRTAELRRIQSDNRPEATASARSEAGVYATDKTTGAASEGQTLTPGDQGSSEADMDLTKRIRRAVVQKEGLSMNAKNIKIITANGKVTLRGPVNSQQEKDAIESLAKSAAGGATVDNQIEIKANN